MLTNGALREEIAAIDSVIDKLKLQGKEYESASLKSQELTLKLLHDIRTNLVTIMKHFNIALVQPTERGIDGQEGKR